MNIINCLANYLTNYLVSQPITFYMIIVIVSIIPCAIILRIQELKHILKDHGHKITYKNICKLAYKNVRRVQRDYSTIRDYTFTDANRLFVDLLITIFMRSKKRKRNIECSSSLLYLWYAIAYARLCFLNCILCDIKVSPLKKWSVSVERKSKIILSELAIS